MEWARDWYLLLSRPSTLLAAPLGDLAASIDLPLASAFLFGLIGSIAPCQLSTNASAMAFLSREGRRRVAGHEAAAFVLGKAVVYTALWALALALGTQLQRAAVPMAIVTRRALGPVLVLIGLGLVGAVRLRGGLGTRLSERLRRVAPGSGASGAFVLGAAFALAFCPTLFWLFFGLTVPLGLVSPLGVAFPALFAVGTSAPVLVLGALLAAGAPAGAGVPFARAGRILTRVAGAVLVVIGVNDTLIYWAL